MKKNARFNRMHPGRSNDPLHLVANVRALLRQRIGEELEMLSAAPDDDAHSQMRRLGQLVTGLADAAELHLDAERAGFGATVDVVDLASAQRISFTLMSGTNIDVTADQVSMESPIGAALLGARAGDVIDVDTPKGPRTFRVERVHTLLRAFGIGQERRAARAGCAGDPVPAA